MPNEYKGEEYIYAVAIPPATTGAGTGTTGTSETIARPFNQTDGGTKLEADEIELDTKDRSGSDYGKVKQTMSLEGVLTEGDPFIGFMKDAVRNKQFVDILEINTRTKESERGSYMVTSFERTYSYGDYAQYSLEASLNGTVSSSVLTTIPEGAPDPNAGA